MARFISDAWDRWPPISLRLMSRLKRSAAIMTGLTMVMEADITQSYHLERSTLSLDRIALPFSNLLTQEIIQFLLNLNFPIGHQAHAIGKIKWKTWSLKSKLDILSWQRYTIMMEHSLGIKIYSWCMNLQLSLNKIHNSEDKPHYQPGAAVIKVRQWSKFTSQKMCFTTMKLRMQMLKLTIVEVN